jgi:hypothetical protein
MMNQGVINMCRKPFSPLAPCLMSRHVIRHSSSGGNQTVSIEQLIQNTEMHFKKHKTIFDAPRRIVCMGDIHGDLNALEDMLMVAGLVKTRGGVWSGGSTMVVQVGRCDGSSQCFDIFVTSL